MKPTYLQTKQICKMLQPKLDVLFWPTLSKQEKDAEKDAPTDIKYYRISYCEYKDFPLLNVHRFFPDRSKHPGKAYATINLRTMRSTANSEHLVEFEDNEADELRTIFDL